MLRAAPMFTPTLEEAFEDQGYLIIENIFAPADLKPLFDDYANLLDVMARRWLAEGVIPESYDHLPFEERAAAIISQIDEFQYRHFDIALPNTLQSITEETPIHLSEAVFNLLTHPRLLDHVERFIGPEILANPIQHVRIKPPEGLTSSRSSKPSGLVTRTGWHQDQGVARPEADETQMLTVWLAITDATEENGCLCIIPGSHRSGLVTHCTAGGVTIPESLLEPQQVSVPMRAGSALFMHRRTKHASLTNRSSGIRWSFDLRYQPIGQPTGREEFPSTIVRSRARPESVVTDWRAWAAGWLNARAGLADRPMVKSHRWSGDDPACA